MSRLSIELHEFDVVNLDQRFMPGLDVRADMEFLVTLWDKAVDGYMAGSIGPPPDMEDEIEYKVAHDIVFETVARAIEVIYLGEMPPVSDSQKHLDAILDIVGKYDGVSAIMDIHRYIDENKLGDFTNFDWAGYSLVSWEEGSAPAASNFTNAIAAGGKYAVYVHWGTDMHNLLFCPTPINAAELPYYSKLGKAYFEQHSSGGDV